MNPTIVQKLVLLPIHLQVERLVDARRDSSLCLDRIPDLIRLPLCVHAGNVHITCNLDEFLLRQAGRLAVIDAQNLVESHLYHVLHAWMEPLVISRDGYDVRLDVLANLKEVPDRLGNVATCVRVGLDDRSATAREALGNRVKVRLLSGSRANVETGAHCVPAVRSAVRHPLVLFRLGLTIEQVGWLRALLLGDGEARVGEHLEGLGRNWLADLGERLGDRQCILLLELQGRVERLSRAGVVADSVTHDADCGPWIKTRLAVLTGADVRSERGRLESAAPVQSGELVSTGQHHLLQVGVRRR